MCQPTNQETSKPAMSTKLKEIMGKLATMVCAPCEPKAKEAHGHVMSKVEDMKKVASTVYDDSKVKVTEIHGNVSSKLKEASGKASVKYVEHVEPKVKKAQEIHGNVILKLKDVSDKTSASYKDNVAPHVEKLSTTASTTYNEKIVPAVKIVGEKAAATFNETVVPKVKEQTANLKKHAEPKLKELNDKATVKMQEGKAYASTACTEFSDKFVAAIRTPFVKKIDPNDGQPYTWDEVLQHYLSPEEGYTETEIKAYWNNECKTIPEEAVAKLKESMGKLATTVCAPCEPKAKEAHGHVMSKVEDIKKVVSTVYDDSKVKVTEMHGNVSSKVKEFSGKASAKYVEHVEPKVTEIHGNVSSKLKEASGKASVKYVEHVEPKVKKAQEIHGNVIVRLKDVSDKTSASYKDNVAPHVEKLSTTASTTYNEKIVPAVKNVGEKAAATFNETVVPKVKEHTANLKKHAEPKLKELNDKATVKMQEGKAYASTACTEFSGKVVAAICTPKVKELHEKVKESEAAQKISKAYDDHGAAKVKSFKKVIGQIAAMVCADLASTVKYYKGEVPTEEVKISKEEAKAVEAPKEEVQAVEAPKEEAAEEKVVDVGILKQKVIQGFKDLKAIQEPLEETPDEAIGS